MVAGRMPLPVYDPLDPEHRRDPYPGYHALRREDPVHRSPLFGAWVLSRHADVAAVLRDPRFRSGRDGDLTPQTPMPEMRPELRDVGQALKRSVIFADPPRHTALRALLAPTFAPRRIEALRPRIQQIASELIAAIQPRGRADAVAEFAQPLPLTVISELFGVPPAERRDFGAWTHVLSPFCAQKRIRSSRSSCDHGGP